MGNRCDGVVTADGCDRAAVDHASPSGRARGRSAPTRGDAKSPGEPNSQGKGRASGVGAVEKDDGGGGEGKVVPSAAAAGREGRKEGDDSQPAAGSSNPQGAKGTAQHAAPGSAGAEAARAAKRGRSVSSSVDGAADSSYALRAGRSSLPRRAKRGRFRSEDGGQDGDESDKSEDDDDEEYQHEETGRGKAAGGAGGGRSAAPAGRSARPRRRQATHAPRASRSGTRPSAAMRAADLAKVNEFFESNGCKCQRFRCTRILTAEEVAARRAALAAMSERHKEMYVFGQLVVSQFPTEMPGRPTQTRQRERNAFRFDAKRQVCLRMFLFVNQLKPKRYKMMLRHLHENGPIPRRRSMHESSESSSSALTSGSSGSTSLDDDSPKSAGQSLPTPSSTASWGAMALPPGASTAAPGHGSAGTAGPMKSVGMPGTAGAVPYSMTAAAGARAPYAPPGWSPYGQPVQSAVLSNESGAGGMPWSYADLARAGFHSTVPHVPGIAAHGGSPGVVHVAGAVNQQFAYGGTPITAAGPVAAGHPAPHGAMPFYGYASAGPPTMAPQLVSRGGVPQAGPVRVAGQPVQARSMQMSSTQQYR